MAHWLNDIEEFTVDELLREVKRREEAKNRGVCWYCGQSLENHTCKHSEAAKANVQPDRPPLPAN